ncbi:PREDICTED: pectinesterase-like [Ipomoea nil]|uniref:pectinesterase-like n=1 Tax=Ipomoea nil TaxID=35883 RepID=UPI0009010545|nr:PREDICTED: pectinesterase-like [Ipomoea nil]
MPTIKEFFAGVSLSGEPQKGKKIILALFASVLLVAAVVGVVTGVKSMENNSGNGALSSEAHAVVKSSCSSTFYPELCFSAIANGGGGVAGKKLSSQKDVIEISLNITITAVDHNSAAIKKLIKARKNLNGREKTALRDCMEMVDETLHELHATVKDLEQYPTKKSLIRHADDLKTLVSSAITNQGTCLDGFSHEDADKHVREALIDGQEHVEKMCSNSLAMIKNMTDTDILNQKKLSGNTNKNRKLKEDHNDGAKWPEWLSAGDRKLLQSSNVKPDVVVAADGSGKYRTVSEAVAKAPERSSRRYVIRIKAGLYKENVDVPITKTNIMFVGDGRISTVIAASRNVVDGSTTFHSATVGVVGARFFARDITFQNTAGPANQQAVALRVGSDQSAFYRCNVIAYQDSLYVHSNRQFFVNCYVVGTIDFIFGNSAVVFQDCDIHARRPGPQQKNIVTAQGRMDRNQNTGIVIQKSRIGATPDLRPFQKEFPTFLGRPWMEYSRTVIMQSSITDVIDPAGWDIWDGNFALNTLVYREYNNTGAGADTSRRVNWKGFKVITNSAEVVSYTPGVFIDGDNWLSGTGIPFSLGL